MLVKSNGVMNDLNEKRAAFLLKQNNELFIKNSKAVEWFKGKIAAVLNNPASRAAYVNLYAQTGKMESVPHECKTGEIDDGPDYTWDYVKSTIQSEFPGVYMYSGSIYADGPSFEISPKAFSFSNEELDFARNDWLKKDEISQQEALKEIIPKLDNLVEKIDPVLCAEAHKKWYVEHGYFTDVLCDCTTDYVQSSHKNLSSNRLKSTWKKEGFGIQHMEGKFRAFMTKDEAFKHI